MKKSSLLSKPSLTLTCLFMGIAAVAAALGMNGDAMAQTASPAVVLGTNDSGMHCIDSDYSILAILPLGNHQRVQVVMRASTGGSPTILTNQDVQVTYEAILDPSLSINSTSIGKTNFWTYVLPLYGVSLAPNTGFQGQQMPGSANIPRLFNGFDPASNRFDASGIPITPIDDSMATNNYPLLQLKARNAAGALLGSLSSVVPVSTESRCSDCHATGRKAATRGFRGVPTWSTLTNIDLQTRANVLILHDAVFGTSLMTGAAAQPINIVGRLFGQPTVNQLPSTPVNCSSCHYSLANDVLVHGTPVGPTTAQTGQPTLSAAMHLRHGSTINGAIPVPNMGIKTCYECHPGRSTQCFRGAMARAGLICQNCHGGLLAVGGKFPLKSTTQPRRPWIDLPTCQACHTGDALSYQGGDLILRMAYVPSDPSATPRVATNTRFEVPSGVLYMNGLGHNGIACEGCHGSPHAIWPTRKANDNIAATQIQGHTGQIIECSVCHNDTLQPTLDGPHGLHNINDQGWVQGHGSFFESSRSSCQTCHGKNGQGTAISRAAAARTFTTENGSVFIRKRTPVQCGMCHDNPLMSGM